LKPILKMLGLSLGGWVGWWLGDHIGLITAYFLSLFGAATGLYMARQIARDLP